MPSHLLEPRKLVAIGFSARGATAVDAQLNEQLRDLITASPTGSIVPWWEYIGSEMRRVVDIAGLLPVMESGEVVGDASSILRTLMYLRCPRSTTIVYYAPTSGGRLVPVLFRR